MNTGCCGKCRHWEPDASETALRGAKWGRCALTASSLSDPAHAGTLAFAVDLEECQAILRCRAEFGCVQYEAGVNEGAE